MKSFEKRIGNIIFTVDYRTELLSIILILSENYKKMVGKKMIPLGNKYIYDRVHSNFDRFKNHKTMVLFEDIIKKHPYFNYDSPVTLFLSLDENLKCERLNNYLYIDILGCDDKIYEFIDSLSKFSNDINFDEYYESNKAEYLMFIDEICKHHITNNLDIFLNDFFNMNTDYNLYVNAIAFNSTSSYSSYVYNNVYSSLGITQFSKMENLYKDWELDNGDMLLVSLHEFCHSYVNPLTKKYLDVSKFTYVLNDNMHKFAYDDVETIINENIVRAIVLHYEKIYLSSEKYKKDYNREKNMGFDLIDKILAQLDRYSNNRNKYNTFEEFYVELLKAIE